MLGWPELIGTSIATKEHAVTTTIKPRVRFPHWREIVVYSADGPQPQFLLSSDSLNVIVVGLEAGQQIPPHAESLAMYHVLEGDGIIFLDDEMLSVEAGDTVIAPKGATRGVRAESKLAFIATKV